MEASVWFLEQSHTQDKVREGFLVRRLDHFLSTSFAPEAFCCIGALAIANALDKVDRDLLGWWLAERQLEAGGLNGRPEKGSGDQLAKWLDFWN